MLFQHSSEIWRDFPELVPGLLFAEGITPDVSVSAPVTKFTTEARSRLAQGPEGELAEVQAWRRAFARMGLKPTQYRCAAESLLRRLRTQGSLPRLHPLVDLCNAISVAYAIPVAVFDVSKLTGDLEVRYAAGNEAYLTFAGEVEHPAPHEVIFADRAASARPAMDKPAERTVGRPELDDRRADRGRSDARHGVIGHAPAHRGYRWRAGGRLARQAGGHHSEPALVELRLRAVAGKAPAGPRRRRG